MERDGKIIGGKMGRESSKLPALDAVTNAGPLIYLAEPLRAEWGGRSKERGARSEIEGRAEAERRGVRDCRFAIADWWLAERGGAVKMTR